MLKNKKILFLLHIPPPLHGSSMVGHNIFKSELVNQNFDSRFINLLLSKKISQSNKISLPKIFNQILIYIKILLNIIFYRPKLCYLALTVSGPAFFKDVVIVFLLKIFSIQCIYHLHNKGVKKKQHLYIYDILYRFVFKNVEVILLSKILYKDIEKYVSFSNVSICPNGIKDVEYNYKTKKNNENHPQLLFLSNLIEDKGVFILLEACKILKDNDIDFQCVYVGAEGDISSNVFQQKVDRLNLIDKISYKGPLYNQDKYKIYSQSDVFIFPTFYKMETFGLVILEAMQHSLPVIATNEGGIPDLVENKSNGFLVPKKNSKELASKIEILINNQDLRKKMGEKSREKYKKEFTLDKFEKRLCEILNNLI